MPPNQQRLFEEIAVAPPSQQPNFPVAWQPMACPASAIRASAENGTAALPSSALLFKAFELVGPDAVKVCILGQDPYPTPGDAMGLAFSVPRGRALPRSLRNIFKEMAEDIGACPQSGDLTGLAQQGVLLANTALTVLPGAAGSLSDVWSAFTEAWISKLGNRPRPIVWILWGNHAQRYRPLIGEHHPVISSAHPSPLSARRGFFGSRPFSRTNHILQSLEETPIDWTYLPSL